MAAARKFSERGAERGVAFRRDDLLLDHRGGRVGWHMVFRRQAVVVMATRYPQNSKAFTLGRCRQPAGQRRRLAEAADLLDQPPPDTLAHAVRIVPGRLGAGAAG